MYLNIKYNHRLSIDKEFFAHLNNLKSITVDQERQMTSEAYEYANSHCGIAQLSAHLALAWLKKERKRSRFDNEYLLRKLASSLLLFIINI
jgi:hypothetical protein